MFQQSPPTVVELGSEVQIDCRHDDQSLVIMLWYQQQEDNQALDLIAYGYETSPNYMPRFKDQVTISRESAVAGSLQILRAELSHSAVYFCAASAQ